MRQFSQQGILKIFYKNFTPIFVRGFFAKFSLEFVVNHLIIE